MPEDKQNSSADLHSLYQGIEQGKHPSAEVRKSLNQVVDIFAEVDDPDKPLKIKKQEKKEPEPEKMPWYKEADKILLVSGLLAMVVLFFVGIWYSAFRTRQTFLLEPEKQNQAQVEANKTQKESINKKYQFQNNQPNNLKTATSSLVKDFDSDGLTDKQEKLLGTNPKKMDTDQDGLFDGEEVNIYKTNPLNPDTDADGYDDGDEVKAGYNPLGAGKLIKK